VPNQTFRRWTADDIAKLKNLAQKQPRLIIAAELGRSTERFTRTGRFKSSHEKAEIWRAFSMPSRPHAVDCCININCANPDLAAGYAGGFF
jgi:hypothetical protein